MFVAINLHILREYVNANIINIYFEFYIKCCGHVSELFDIWCAAEVGF